MANNRLYLVDTKEKEYQLLAKGWGIGWEMWNKDIKEFLEQRFSDNDSESHLIIGTENDNEFFDKYLDNPEYTSFSESR